MSAVEQRFWSKVDKSGDCWLWTATSSYGYGYFWVHGKRSRAHRVAYELLVGPIPEGLTLDHLCRNRACVNPAHLEAVTDRENILRGTGHTAINARKTHCHRGHEFTPENTYLQANGGRGSRKCKTCHRESTRRQRARARAAIAEAQS